MTTRYDRDKFRLYNLNPASRRSFRIARLKVLVNQRDVPIAVLPAERLKQEEGKPARS